MQAINIGLSEEQRSGICEILNYCLADTYLLVIKTRKYHWDVVGPQFRSLHEIFQEQYEAMLINVDNIAERVRALGGYPLGTAEGFIKFGSLKEHPNDLPNVTTMVERLVSDHAQIIRNLRRDVVKVEEEFGDRITSDFLSEIAMAHEEIAWMLRSFIEGNSISPDPAAAKPREVTI